MTFRAVEAPFELSVKPYTDRALAGMKHREIASMLDMPLSTVLSKYNRSLKKLKTMLGDML